MGLVCTGMALMSVVLWMGKGFQEHSHTLKRNVQTDKILKSKEAIYWEWEDMQNTADMWDNEEKWMKEYWRDKGDVPAVQQGMDKG